MSGQLGTLEDLPQDYRAAMTAAGVGAGDLVAVESGRGIDYWVDVLAVWSLHAVMVPLDGRDEPARRKLITDQLGQYYLSAMDGSVSLQQADQPKPDVTGAGAIVFTSGSTGLPKGAVLTLEQVFMNARSTLEHLPVHDRHAVAIPFHFVSALSHFMAAFLSGGALIGTERRLFPADLTDLIAESRATSFGGAPVQLNWIADGEGDRVPTLQWVMSSGDALQVSTIRRLQERFPSLEIYTLYGLTELAGRFCILPAAEVETFAGSVGRPITGLAARVAGEQGETLPPKEVGEIVASGPLVKLRYLHEPMPADPDAERSFPTGDLGYMAENGLIYLSGRRDDVFKVGGEKVSSVEVQEAIRQTGLVSDCAVVGHDSGLGTMPVAFVVPASDDFSQAALLKALRASLRSYSLPRQVRVVDEIPRTGSGKIKRAEIRALL